MILKQVNSLLVNNEFEKALALLETSSLSEEVRNECLGNYYYYKHDYEKAKEILVNATQLCEEKVMKDQEDNCIGAWFKKEQQKKTDTE